MREGGRERGREGGREGRDRGREGGREGYLYAHILCMCLVCDILLQSKYTVKVCSVLPFAVPTFGKYYA